MVKETLKRIFDFLEDNEGHNAPFKWKLVNNEPIAKEDLNIKGGLFLEHSNIASLPEGLKIGGNLNLSYTFKLKSLPSDLDVKGNIYLEGSNITSLPEDLQVGGDLDLSDTQVKLLPKGLQVGGDLELIRTKITLLPKGLKVKGELIIKNTALLEYIDEELRDMVNPGFILGKIVR